MNIFRLLLITLAAFTAYIVLLPLSFLIFGSFYDSPPGSPGEFTIKNYIDMFLNPGTYRLLLTTFIFASSSTAIALVIGTLIAWLVTRTNAPFKRFYDFLMISIFVTPAVLTAVAWIFMASPRTGLLNAFYRWVFGVDEPLLNIFSLEGMVLVQAIRGMPIVYLLMGAALRNMDPAYEEAARTAGSGVLATLMRIVLPIVKPAIYSSALLIFIVAFEAFDVPLFLGVPANISVLSTRIWLLIGMSPARYQAATTYSVLMLVIAILLLYMYRRATKKAEKFVAITGKGYTPRIIDLGRLRYPITIITLSILTIMLLIPYVVIVWISLVPFFLPSVQNLLQFTLKNYADVLSFPLVGRAFINSFILSAAGSTILMLMTAFAAFIVYKIKIRGGTFIDSLIISPIAFPAVILGIGFIWAYLILPLGLYQTIWILLIAYLARYMGHASRFMASTVLQIGNELEESSRISGAGIGYTFKNITLPLMRSGFVAGWLWVFAHLIREFPVSIMLYSPGNEVLAVILYTFFETNLYEPLAAISVLMLAIIIAIWMVLQKVLKVEFRV